MSICSTKAMVRSACSPRAGLAIAYPLQDCGVYRDASNGDTLIHVRARDAAATAIPATTIVDMRKAIDRLRTCPLPVMNNTAAPPEWWDAAVDPNTITWRPNRSRGGGAEDASRFAATIVVPTSI